MRFSLYNIMANPFKVQIDELGARVNTSLKFRIACNILERWAMVVGQKSGEDSQGRAFFDLYPVEDTVQRAIDLADQFVDAAFELEWIESLDISEEELADRLSKFDRKRQRF